MREKERIKRIIGLLEFIWEENPDMRFCQLLVNIGVIPYSPGNCNFNVEDNLVEKSFEKFITTNKFKRKLEEAQTK